MMNIILAINDSYVEPAIILLCSLFYNNKNRIKIYFFDSSLSLSSKERLRKYIEDNKQEVEFVSVDRKLFEKAPERAGLSIETYFRLLAPWILPDVEKVLYIDADMIVDGRIEELWNQNINDYYVAGVVDQGTAPMDYYHRAELGLKKETPYINGGLLLMNLEKIRRDYNQDSIWDVIKSRGSRLIYQDQDIINIMFEENIFVLSEIYNFVPLFTGIDDYWDYLFNRYKKPIIIHYFGETKPWYKGYGFKFLKTFKKYCKQVECETIAKAVNDNLKSYGRNLYRQLKYLNWRKKYYNNDLLKERDMNLYWVQHSGTYIDYLKELGYQNVAIYGIGRTGKVLISELREIVTCVIDKYSNEKIEDYIIIRPKDYKNNADIIIVTVWNRFDEIYNDIKENVNCPIVSIEDLIYKFL